jgi:hypothetical protein
MRRLLLTGLLVAALAGGCESSKLPTGPASLVLETSTSTSTVTTTTAVIPGLRYIASPAVSQNFKNLPSDMTLFLQPVASASGRLGDLLSVLATSTTYNVTGIWNNPSGLTGQVKGTWTGTLDSGNFRGTLTAVQSGCTAEREFSGPINAQTLQWTAGAVISDCAGQPLAFSSLMLLKSDAGPPTSTSVPVTTTVSTTTTSAVVCTYAITPTFMQVTAGGGNFRVVLSTKDTCPWTAQAAASWIAIQGPLTGEGEATIPYIVGPNTGAQRTGAIIVGGITMFIFQDAAGT